METYSINIQSIKDNIEQEIRQLQLKLYDKQFALSEIKNIIRKNCIHEWKQTDIEMGHSSFSESMCSKCGSTINNNFDKINEILLK
jgi:hypothetical protein